MQKLNTSLLFSIAVALVLVSGAAYYLGTRHAATATSHAQTSRYYNLPTASEVFKLRSDCADLGEKKLENNVVGIALTQSQTSYYNPTTNRCFVELFVQSADLRSGYFGDYLYDGQTGEILASAKKEDGKKDYGIIFAGPTEPTNTAYDGDTYAATANYISEVMKDDWHN